MATTSLFSIDVEDNTIIVEVPDDDVARLMYYLQCVTVSVGLDILQDDLVDFQNYLDLSPQRIALVLKYAIKFSPDEFLDKLIFLDDEGEVVTGTSENKFVNISTACNVVHVQSNVAIAGRVTDVATVMFFQSSWLNYFYHAPIDRFFMGATHCIHCRGESGVCPCDACRQISDSQSQSSNVLVDALSSTSISLPAESTQTTPALSPASHLANCDGCGSKNFEGSRFRCEDCEDFDLCQACYTTKRHTLTHRFMQIETPGSKPIRLLARESPSPGVDPLPPISRAPTMNPAATAVKSATAHGCHCDGCGWQFIDGSRYKCEVCDDFDLCKDCYTAKRHSLDHWFMQIDRPESTAIHLVPRASLRATLSPHGSNSPVPLSAPPLLSTLSNTNPPPCANSAASPGFYYNMKVSELKDFLKENGVAHEDAINKDALSRLAWDAHCDSMTVSELNIYLTDNKIPTDDCRNIASRREKAKESFRIPPPPPEATPREICDNDIVVLTGLSHADMNGKQATVLQADCGGGRAEVHVEELGRAFKVKLENLILVSNDVDGQADDFLD